MTLPSFPKEPLHEAMLYSSLPDKQVRCFLCARTCIIPDGSLGFCQVRKNENGKLYALSYGKACSVAVDPITKKPLAHFHPGASVLSIATGGCNFRCQFCDNWMISQEKIGGTDLPPNEVVRATETTTVKGSATPTPSQPSSSSTHTTQPNSHTKSVSSTPSSQTAT